MGEHLWLLLIPLAFLLAYAVHRFSHWRRKRDTGLMLEDVSRTAAFALRLEELADMILDAVTRTMHVEGAAFFVRQEERFQLIAQRKLDWVGDCLSCDHVLVQALSEQDQVVALQEVEGLLPFSQEGRRAAGLAIPLRAKGQLAGVFVVGPKALGEPYSADDRLALATLANQAAMAIENIRLYQAMRQELADRQKAEKVLRWTYRSLERRNRLLTQLLGAANSMLIELELEPLLHKIAQAAQDALEFGTVLLNLVGEQDGEMRAIARVGSDEAGREADDTVDIWLRWDDFLQTLDDRYRIGRCYFIPHGEVDWTEKHGYRESVCPGEGEIAEDGERWHSEDVLFALIELPKGKVVGMISVDKPLDGLRPSQETFQALELFANLVAVAIENSRLFDRLQTELAERRRAEEALRVAHDELELRVQERTVELARANEALEAEILVRKRGEREIARRLTQTRILRDVMLDAASTLDFDQVLERTVEALRARMGIKYLAFLLPEETGRYLCLHSAELGFAPLGAEFCVPVDQSICGQVLMTGEPILVGDVRQSPLYFEGRPDTRSELAVPISIGGEINGVLNLESPRLHAFDERDLDFYLAIAGQLGVALSNARLYEEVCRQADELTLAVNRLEELDRLKSEFIQNVSHELRSPLALVRGYAEMLDSGELGPLLEEQQGAARVIARRARMLGELVEDIILILLDEQISPTRESAAFDELAQAAVEDFQVVAEQAGLELCAEIAPCSAIVRGPATHIRRVLDNLLGNAIKFTPQGGRVTVRFWCDEEQATLNVADTGVGIPPDEQKLVFERFYQVDGSSRRRYGGLGLGLALVREIVQARQGQVFVESEVGKGSTFTVILPLYQPGKERGS
ncbi:MAG: GAF domain-containing protein [Anaerolineae bacterium]|nr:GAF domain-containing protein [Anaerolineae bacterium]